MNPEDITKWIETGFYDPKPQEKTNGHSISSSSSDTNGHDIHQN